MEAQSFASKNHSGTKFHLLQHIVIETLLAASLADFLSHDSLPKPILLAGLGAIKFSLSHNLSFFFSILLPFFRSLMCWVLQTLLNQDMKIKIFSILLANSLAIVILTFGNSKKMLQKLPALLFLGLFITLSQENFQKIVTFSSIPECTFSLSDSMIFEIVLSFSLLTTSIQSNHHAHTFQLSKTKEEHIKLKNFIHTLSHELRNPLNSLLGNLALAQGERVSNQANENLSTAKACGEFLLQFINNILDTGKLEAGGLEINPSRVDPRDLFRKLWRINSDLIKMKKIEGQFRINGIPSKIKIDPHRVSQILFNLIGNAVKFTEKGTIKVIVSWVDDLSSVEECFHPIPYSEEEGDIFDKDLNISIVSLDSMESEMNSPFGSKLFSKGYLKLIVADTGVGMTPEEVGKLFNKFSQVGNDSKKQLGSGLGLNIAKEICQKMGGDLKLFSKKNKGTTAIAVIPSQVLSESGDLSERTSEEKKIKIGACFGPQNKALLEDYSYRIGGECIDLNNKENFEEVFKGGKILDAIYFDKESEGKLRVFLDRAENYPKAKELSLIYVGDGKDHINSNTYNGHFVCKINKPLFFDDFVQSLNRIIL